MKDFIEDILKKFDEQFVDYKVESSHYEQKWQEFKRIYDLPVQIKSFVNQSLLSYQDKVIEEMLRKLLKCRIEGQTEYSSGKVWSGRRLDELVEEIAELGNKLIKESNGI